MSTSVTPLRPSKKSGITKEIARVLVEAQSTLRRTVELLLEKGLPTTAGELHDFEQELHNEVAQACVDPIVGEVVRAAHNSLEVSAAASELVGQYADIRLQKSAQEVTIRLFGGSTVSVSTPYFLLRQASIPGRKRQKGDGHGVYPRLAVLGIHFRVSPALAAEVGRLVALGPIEQSRDSLALRGVDLDIKTVHRLARCLGQRALHYREWLQDKENSQAARTTWAVGMRIVFAVDGGRVRTRIANQQPVPPNKKRRGFIPKWREPKVIVVYAIDEKGRKKRLAGMYYDATMGDADETFRILDALLRRIGAEEAAEWIVVADGAAWIWNRIAPLAESLGFPIERVTEVVDFYHACEHLHDIADIVVGWNDSQRTSWFHRMRQLLRDGRVNEVVEEAGKLTLAPTKGDGPADPLGYFIEHAHRMRYTEYRDRGVPLGSGAVESAVRRIVNLRLKSNGSFWDVRNAEVVLHLRAQLLSGRWDTFIRTVLDDEVFWYDRTRRPQVPSAA
jgi:hypothetical protein